MSGASLKRFTYVSLTVVKYLQHEEFKESREIVLNKDEPHGDDTSIDRSDRSVPLDLSRYYCLSRLSHLPCYF
jgi:hypothetical protein